jgi:serine/threonine protein kinase
MIVCPYCGTSNDDNATTCRTCGASLTGAKYPTALPIGTKLQSGKYLIESVLGQGGFGITYKAKSTALGIPVVVKEFHPQGATRAGSSLRPPGTLTQKDFVDARDKFADEARVVAQLTYATPNPNIVRVYDVFTENETEYYAMEFLDGKPLSKLVEKQGPYPEADVLTIASQLVSALTEVHAAGLLHRDIKPDNIMMVARGAVLIDFGSARAIAAGGRQSIIVTPGYAPLEQYASEAKRGPFTDVYALGGTLFFALTAQEPVPATDRASGVKQPTAREVNSRISKGMSDSIDRAMRMKIDERPQTAAAFLADLQKSVGKLPASTIGQPKNVPASSPVAPTPTPKANAPVVNPATNQPDPNRGNFPYRPAPMPGIPNPVPPLQGSSPAPTPARASSATSNLVLGLFVIFGAMILLGELGYLPNQVAVAGFYLVVLLAAYLVIQWLVFTRTGRIILFVLVAAAAAAYYFYSQGAFGATAQNNLDLAAKQYAETVHLKVSQYAAQNPSSRSFPSSCVGGLNLDGKIVVSAPVNVSACWIAISNAGNTVRVEVAYSGGTSNSVTVGR